VHRHFDRAAAGFHTASVLHKRVGKELVERLSLVDLSPRHILDLGCGTGWCAAFLSHRFGQSAVVGLDLSEAMLRAGEKTTGSGFINGDAHRLPLADQCVDLIFSNLLLPWCDTQIVFSEACRVLRPGGLFTFSSCGPDSLRELAAAWAMVDEGPHVHTFSDMHDLGDSLAQSGFSEPVMDVEMLTFTYRTLEALVTDLRATGARNALSSRQRGLRGSGQGQRLKKAYESLRGEDGTLPLSWEVIYGVAWCPAQPALDRLSPDGIPVRVSR
jgi:malonyl-CoA O-methyltransferase